MSGEQMIQPVTLHGYRFSVYNRIIRMALHEKGVGYEIVEVDPFTELAPDYLELHPFGRVPVLVHGAFALFETSAISRYVDNAFDGPALQPTSSQAVARMDQVIAVIDNYGYWPMVRQVFSHRVFRPLQNEPWEEDENTAGLEASKTVLTVLNGIAEEGLVLNGQTITLADCHLAPMVDYFTKAAEGSDALKSFPALAQWWNHLSSVRMMLSTDPQFSDYIWP